MNEKKVMDGKKPTKHTIQIGDKTFEKLNSLQQKLKEAFKTRYTKDEVIYALIEYFKMNINAEELLKFKRLLDEAKLKGKEEKQADLSDILKELKEL